jgi:hypothetical protein
MMREQQAQMPQDQTTVAQDAVAAAGVPQGGLADMAQAMAPRTDMDMNTGVAPVERMRDGGVVRMQPGGLAGISRDVRDFAPRLPAEIASVAREDFALLSPEEQLDIIQFEDPTATMRARGAEVYPEYDYRPTGQGFFIETFAPGAAEEIRQRNAAIQAAEEAAAAETEEATAPSVEEEIDLSPGITFDSEPSLSFGEEFGDVDPDLVRRGGTEELTFGAVTPTGAPIPLALARGAERGDREPPATGGGGAAAPAMDDAFEQDKWLALAQAGLSLMSSQQPTFGGAIGEAGLSGITALRTAREERDARAAAAQARADRLAAAARTDREDAYPYRQVDDLIGLADSFSTQVREIVESNYGVVPRPGEPLYDTYEEALANANVYRTLAREAMGVE